MLAQRVFLITNKHVQYIKKICFRGNYRTDIELIDDPEEALAFCNEEQAEEILGILERRISSGFHIIKHNFLINWPFD